MKKYVALIVTILLSASSPEVHANFKCKKKFTSVVDNLKIKTSYHMTLKHDPEARKFYGGLRDGVNRDWVAVLEWNIVKKFEEHGYSYDKVTSPFLCLESEQSFSCLQADRMWPPLRVEFEKHFLPKDVKHDLTAVVYEKRDENEKVRVQLDCE